MTKHPKEAERLTKIIESFPKITITVVGDLVGDEFIFGEISRVSREAPVLILKHRERTVVPGGGANAINNLADLGVNVLPVGVVGDDEVGRLLLKAFRHKHIPVSGILKDKSYTTVTKTRILAGMTHNARQQVVRVDREPETEPNRHLQRELVLAARQYARASDALLISDYGYGAASPAILDAIRERGVSTVSRSSSIHDTACCNILAWSRPRPTNRKSKLHWVFASVTIGRACAPPARA
jgi:D-glycero-beta-D-manno-heptose-7-phosphate kinase